MTVGLGITWVLTGLLVVVEDEVVGMVGATDGVTIVGGGLR